MSEDLTYEAILSRMLEKIPNDIDKREGSVIFDALAPAAAELQQMYITVASMLNECFADSAGRQYLIKRAKERGVTPYEASNAIAKGEFDAEIPQGCKFLIEGYTYEVGDLLEKSGDIFYYKMICEKAGEEPNHILGKLTPVEHINGLTTAKLTDILIPGENEEDTEKFRKRYLSSFDMIAFGGNEADYKKNIKAIDGVGGIKLYRAWNGGGTVKAVISAADATTPSESLIEKAQNIIDPSKTGEGYGIAPIGHKVTIEAVAARKIDMVIKAQYDDNVDFEQSKLLIEDAITQYLKELAEKWESKEQLTVVKSHIISRLLDIDDVFDITSITINGKSENLILDRDEIPVKGEIIYE